ncbi:MAG: NAD(P)-dependent oxidoreductase [Gammaproteobacteria bacterium]|nr:NAD(P)-dependent oxidoreductase [Gammaproteobacteria bacterium]MDD9814904.1 NAD(P)-dependent oxidoreductase [Gammaproteobacteria bacterium]
MPTPAEIEKNFTDIHPPLSGHGGLVESARCYFCYDAPCVSACPTGIDIPGFIHQIRSGNGDGAARTILRANIMGGMCARVCPTEILCEEVCVRNKPGDSPVRIGLLQRHATDPVLERGVQFFRRAESTGKRAAVVGAGPAGLACAHQLALFGHAVTVFEKQKKPGGLNEFGIAAYKTVDDFARREVEYILAVGGIEMRAGAELGRDITLEELRGEFDAVFLSPGLGGVNRAGVEGEGLDGVMDAVGFIAALRQAEDKSRIKVGKKIVVIGGGMTAIDIAVQTRKLGAEEVTIVYRRGPEDMRASRHEQDFARSNGVHFRCNARPARFIGEGTVRAAEFTVDGGETITLAADMVFTAIGQALGGGIPEGLSTADGRISVTADRATSIPGVWAGGDCVAGGDNLTVTAVEDGKVAARSIHRFLGGGHG